MTPDAPRREVVAAARTDVGRLRSQNEDAALLRPGAGLFMVADGMGGHAAGEVASALAVETVAERLSDGGAASGGVGRILVAERKTAAGAAPVPAPGDGPSRETDRARRRVREAVETANRRIFRQGRENPDQGGMGTTATVLLLPGPERWVVGQVGDSRAYLLRGDELSRVTTDHTVVPGSSTLTRALGTRADVEVDAFDGDLRPGDLFLLCSDGLTDMMADDDIREALASAAPPLRAGRGDGGGDPGDAPGGAGRDEAVDAVRGAADDLVDEVLERGAHDNVTVAVVGIVGG